MANPWFRLYSEFAHDPKIQMLSEAMQRRYVMLLCLRCSEVLETLHETEIAFQLRLSAQELDVLVFLVRNVVFPPIHLFLISRLAGNTSIRFNCVFGRIFWHGVCFHKFFVFFYRCHFLQIILYWFIFLTSFGNFCSILRKFFRI